MRIITTLLLAATACFAADADYTLGPDSQPQDGVPKGEVRNFKLADSKAFPGTTREWSLYIPKQYDAAKPACAMVFFDGPGYAKADGGFRVPVVFDNLIAKKEMPVTVAIFIAPGTVPAAEPGAKAHSNRSYEYDSLGDLNARFLMEEIIPLARQEVKLTDDAAGWGLAGISSSGIAAFTVAWERPDAFRRVFSTIGTYVSLRGADRFSGTRPQIRAEAAARLPPGWRSRLEHLWR